MNIISPHLQNFGSRRNRAAVIALLAIASLAPLHGETIAREAGDSTNLLSGSSIPTNSVSTPGVVIMPKTHVGSSTTSVKSDDSDTDSDDDSVIVSSGNDPNHSVITVKGGHDLKKLSFGDLESIIIPLAGIAATFGTPILIVFVVCFYRFRSRKERLATVREYLNKGLPVPPQLLDESVKPGEDPGAFMPTTRGRADMRKGIKWAAIGFGISLALFIEDSRSTDWGWGMIPAVIGLGYIVSGWIETRQPARAQQPRVSPPAGIPPL